MNDLPLRSFADVRRALLAGEELALIDVREEAAFARAHPLFAVNLPLSRLELEVLARVPRRQVPVTLYDDGEGWAEQAARRLQEWGYTDVALLEGGLSGWGEAGGELFQDVNVPSKAFGELVAAQRNTPSLAPETVHELLQEGANLVLLDARRFDEHQTMTLPGSISVPGAELVRQVGALAPDPRTRVIVHCAGRTRSLIGAQSLLNAGVPNPVAALRNGTIGWTLAGLSLVHGQGRRPGAVPASVQAEAAGRARAVADRAGVLRLERTGLAHWLASSQRTTYLVDVRTEEEYEQGHWPGSRHMPGGQLVQETDHLASVRGARLVLVEDGGGRADMTASWLAQMGWQVAVLEGVTAADLSETGPWRRPLPPGPAGPSVAPEQLARWLRQPGTRLLDVGSSRRYVLGHVPGACWAQRSRLAAATMQEVERYVITSGQGVLARAARAELEALTGTPAWVLEGGTAAWQAAGLPLETGATRLTVPPEDRYRRPYEGIDTPREAMEAYLQWEYGLVAQLERDGTHGFRVL